MRAGDFPRRGDQVLGREPRRDRGPFAALALALAGAVIRAVLADDRPRPLHERQRLDQVRRDRVARVVLLAAVIGQRGQGAG